jgi:Lipocalin-like domain
MTISRPLTKLIQCIFLAVLFSAPAFAMTEADKFVGVWKLLSIEYRTDDGAVVESPFGAEPEGTIMYDSLGNMAAQIGKKDRPRFSSADRMAGSAEEKKSAFESYIAYFGRYRVDERERTVTHEVQQALFPNWTGSKQVRYYTFADRKLTLRTPPFQYLGKSVTAILLWDKIR